MQVLPSTTTRADISQRWRLVGESSLSALKFFLLVPLFPLLGYYLLDQTGFSQWLITAGVIPGQVLGEGFGHVGLCFSIHYLFNGLREIGKAIHIFMR
jgi:hypothetical protein